MALNTAQWGSLQQCRPTHWRRTYVGIGIDALHEGSLLASCAYCEYWRFRLEWMLLRQWTEHGWGNRHHALPATVTNVQSRVVGCNQQEADPWTVWKWYGCKLLALRTRHKATWFGIPKSRAAALVLARLRSAKYSRTSFFNSIQHRTGPTSPNHAEASMLAQSSVYRHKHFERQERICSEIYLGTFLQPLQHCHQLHHTSNAHPPVLRGDKLCVIIHVYYASLNSDVNKPVNVPRRKITLWI